MKKLIFTFIAILGIAAAAPAKAPETLTLQKGRQKTAVSSKISVRFISVLDDSRCPSNAKCAWAGNARIRIAVSKGKKAPQLFELNSNLKPRSIVFEGYEINFASLTPYPGPDKISHPTIVEPSRSPSPANRCFRPLEHIEGQGPEAKKGDRKTISIQIRFYPLSDDRASSLDQLHDQDN